MSDAHGTAGADGTASRLVRVLMVDDQPLFREAARAVIDATPGFESVAEVPCGEDALALVAVVRPDLVLLDVWLPGIDGFETSRRLTAAYPVSLVVLLSADDDPHLRASAGSCGAGAFMHKLELHPRTLRALWERHRAITPTG